MTEHDFERYATQVPYFNVNEPLAPLLEEYLSTKKGTYLEIGAGDGNNLRRLVHSGLLAGYDRVIATDISEIRVSRILRQVPTVEATTADAQHLPFSDNSVDFSFSNQVIEHVPDDYKMAQEVARVLRPDGIAVFGSVLKLPGAWYYHRCNGKWALDPTHIREYRSERAYHAVFSAAKLECVQTQIQPVAYALSDFLVRILIKRRILSYALSRVYSTGLIVDNIRRLRIPIPRYRFIYAAFRKMPNR